MTSAQELVDALRAIDTPTVSNAIEDFSVRDKNDGFASSEVRCLFPELPSMVGYAVTCTMDSTTAGAPRAMRLWRLIESIAAAEKPTVVVCQYTGSDRLRACFIGDILAALFHRLGVVGVVTDAANRDLRLLQTRAPNLQVFGAGTVASHGNGVITDVNLLVSIAGMSVQPGDLVHGDANGVITVPRAVADGVVVRAREILRQEEQLWHGIADTSTSIGQIREQLAH
jgi:4-hydroxy-4-methyl-2-oxoglutarate aldolase